MKAYRISTRAATIEVTCDHVSLSPSGTLLLAYGEDDPFMLIEAKFWNVIWLVDGPETRVVWWRPINELSHEEVADSFGWKE